jgi:hypothetical protein
MNHIGDVMVSMIVTSVVDRWFEARLGQTKYKAYLVVFQETRRWQSFRYLRIYYVHLVATYATVSSDQ